MFVCSCSSPHTLVWEAVRFLPFLTVGAQLRVYLYEELACVVEDFLFSRSLVYNDFAFLRECVDDEDFDGIAYLFHVDPALQDWIPRYSSYMRDLFHEMTSARILDWLLWYVTPGRELRGATLVTYAHAGQWEMLQRMCEVDGYAPLEYVNIAMFVLRFASWDHRMLSRMFPISMDVSFLYFFHEDPGTYYRNKCKRLRANRKKCLEILEVHRVREGGCGQWIFL